MVWKFTNDRPVYLQIVDTVMTAILSGQFQPGEKFPSVRELAMQAQVNPNTVQHALQTLENSKLLVTESTAGRRVTEDPAILEQIRKERLLALTRQCLAQFAEYGISQPQAAALLADYTEVKEEA